MFTLKNLCTLIVLVLFLVPNTVSAMPMLSVPAIMGIRIEFILFALTLIGVAIYHHHTMYVSLGGLAALLLFKLVFDTDFSFITHIFGGHGHHGEWHILLNLLGLLLGFGILAKYFEDSNVPEWLPKILPDDWTGGLALLFIVLVLSSVLDNIAAGMIGGTIAMAVYDGRLHIGYLAAIVAASNAGGAGSVIGDTTTTLMWIDGIAPFDLLKAFIGSIAAFAVFGIIGAKQQHKFHPIQKNQGRNRPIDFMKIVIVGFILVCTVLTNYFFDFPALGVWIAIIIANFIRKAPWEEIKHSWRGTVFLMALVTAASLMPVNDLPPASWKTAFSYGFLSSVFDNIPLTKLCLVQGGYDWGVLAYAVGYGGSMMWFGSSSGVALSNMFPKIKSVSEYLKGGWHVIVAYVFGFFVLMAMSGWYPTEKRSKGDEQPEHSDVIKKQPQYIDKDVVKLY